MLVRLFSFVAFFDNSGCTRRFRHPSDGLFFPAHRKPRRFLQVDFADNICGRLPCRLHPLAARFRFGRKHGKHQH